MTVINYRKDLTEFERFYKELEPQLSWESIDSDIVRNWMEYMMDRGNSASSVNRRLSALRSFYRFALRRKLIEKDINKYIVDFKGLIHINSLAMGILRGKLQTVREMGGDIKIVNLNKHIQTIFETIGLDEIFEIYKNEEEALKSFK